MDAEKTIAWFSTAIPNVGDAVGMEKKSWYIAIVGNNTEKSSSERLSKMGYECYVPIRQELRYRKDGKRSVVDKILMPTVVFVYCTERQRKRIVNLQYINRFMVNNAGICRNSLTNPLAIIPERQIACLKFMIGNSVTPVTIADRSLRRGDFVRVIRGETFWVRRRNHGHKKRPFGISRCLKFFGCAKLEIDTINVEKID